jgi:hypothetical protein
VVFIGQQPVRPHHGLGQFLDRMVVQVDDGLVDHGATTRARPDERQAGNGTSDRNPQHDVHPGSPSAGHPAPAMSRHH